MKVFEKRKQKNHLVNIFVNYFCKKKKRNNQPLNQSRNDDNDDGYLLQVFQVAVANILLELKETFQVKTVATAEKKT